MVEGEGGGGGGSGAPSSFMARPVLGGFVVVGGSFSSDGNERESAALRYCPWGFDAGRRRPKEKRGDGSDASRFSALWAPRRSLPRAHPPPDRPGPAPPSPRPPPSETVRVTSESGATGCGQAAARLVKRFFAWIFFLFFPRARLRLRGRRTNPEARRPAAMPPRGKPPHSGPFELCPGSHG